VSGKGQGKRVVKVYNNMLLITGAFRPEIAIDISQVRKVAREI